MKSILIRDVPDHLHHILKNRARNRGQSLQRFLMQELIEVANRPTMGEVLDRITSRDLPRVDLESVTSGPEDTGAVP